MAKHNEFEHTKRKRTTQQRQTDKLWGPTSSSGGMGPNICELLWKSVYFADIGITRTRSAVNCCKS
eukprot:2593409-Lingulodinium_polyedra.AAC.1